LAAKTILVYGDSLMLQAKPRTTATKG